MVLKHLRNWWKEALLMLLSNDKQLFNEIIKTISEQNNILPQYIEKDFYALTILKELIKRNPNFVFKGGTSLSVCQHVINRFSEDIDISYAFERITVGQRRAIKQAFFDSIEAASLRVSNAENIRSRRIFNRYLCPYESIWNNSSNHVIVEWATQTPSFPIEVKSAQTIIGKYLESIGRHDLVEKYDLFPFETKTITKERTFVDKIFAICDYHISKKLDRQSRHIYDLHQLLKHIELNSEIINIFNKVKEYRINLDTCYSVKEDKSISSLIEDLINENTYLADYNLKTFPLLYDRTKYDDCVPSLKRIASFLKENNL